jgi:DNA-binding IscR family transcriptional regulator
LPQNPAGPFLQTQSTKENDMKMRLDVQHALACLQALAQHPSLDALALSGQTGIPYAECQELIERFEAAGFVTSDPDGLVKLARPMHELTSLEVIQAVWSQRPAPHFRVLYAPGKRQALAVKNAAASAHTLGAFPSDGPLSA